MAIDKFDDQENSIQTNSNQTPPLLESELMHKKKRAKHSRKSKGIALNIKSKKSKRLLVSQRKIRGDHKHSSKYKLKKK